MVISGLQHFYLMVESFFYDSHTSYLRIAFANTFVKTFGKLMYTKWWQYCIQYIVYNTAVYILLAIFNISYHIAYNILFTILLFIYYHTQVALLLVI